MKPQSSAWPGAVDGILTAFATSNPGLQVVDGPTLSDDQLEDEAALVGNGAPVAGTVTRSAPDYSGRVTEQGTVVCVVTVYSGNGDMVAVRNRVLEIVGALETQLRTDPTLAGNVDDCQIGPEGEWYQTQTPDGAVCAFGFGVSYEAFI